MIDNIELNLLFGYACSGTRAAGCYSVRFQVRGYIHYGVKITLIKGREIIHTEGYVILFMGQLISFFITPKCMTDYPMKGLRKSQAYTSYRNLFFTLKL